jgi:hypothetical protein
MGQRRRQAVRSLCRRRGGDSASSISPRAFIDVDADGTTTARHYLHDNAVAAVLHREDGPALTGVDANGTTFEEYYCNGLLHRTDGPAIITIRPDGSRGERYYREGQLHREDGPACTETRTDGSYVKAYYRDGWPYNQDGVTRAEKRPDGTCLVESSMTSWRTSARPAPSLQDGYQAPD